MTAAAAVQIQATQKKNKEHNMPINNDAGTSTIAQPDPKPGPFLAKIVSNIDPTYMGILEVQLLRPTGNSDSDGQLHQVKYMSPFYSATNVLYNGKDNDYPNTQKSSGMWMAPPDIGQLVMVFFIDGDPRQGYWMGCVPDLNANFMTPGLAATANNVEGGLDTPYGYASRVPVAEYNKNFPGNKTLTDATQIKKPTHPFAQVLADQGLLLDDIRGITTSSSRREAPSEVFGISTQGPIDKTGQKGDYGKNEYMVQNAPIDRMGGSTFVMDDGDDKFLRKKSPSDDGPNYAAVEEGETDGDVHRPHNELIRLRTRTGHQILLHNSEDLIYITNSRGTAWIELTSDGKIDIYSQDSISMHTEQDFNFYAERDINMEAGRNFNIKVTEEMHTHVLKDHILIVDENQKIHIKMDVDKTYDQNYKHHVKQQVDTLYDTDHLHKVGGDFDLDVGGHNFQTSGGSNETKAGGNIVETAPAIHMNGPGASAAASASTAELPKILQTSSLPGPPDGESFVQSIMRRVPTTEPYPQHENLDPKKYKPDLTDRDVETRYEGNSESMLTPPDTWKQYSTSVDTFQRTQPLQGQLEDQYSGII